MFALTPGQPIQIAPGIWRLLALNPGMMSGPGTNTYLLEDGDQGLLVLDPGPDDERHLANIVQAADQLGRTLSRVLVTHTHRDHSPLAAGLVAYLGASEKRWGAPYLDDPLQDESWRPDHPVHDGEDIDLGNGNWLRAISTPGHVSNHYCYWHLQTGLLFSGDHLINGSTVVIAPPNGSMRDYLQSLEKLLPLDFHVIAPGHGDLIRQPKSAIENTIAHRLAREAKVWDALQNKGRGSAHNLVSIVYSDVPPFLHPMAEFSLEAHLIKLWEDGRVSRNDGGEYWL